MKTKKYGIEKSLKIKGKSLPGYRRAKWILSPLCLPFHHTGGQLPYHTTKRESRQGEIAKGRVRGAKTDEFVRRVHAQGII